MRILIPDAQHAGEPDIERAAAGPGAIFVNTARGPLVDLDAVHDGIRSGRLARAALDEPPEPGERLIEAWRRGEEWIRRSLILSLHAAFCSAAGFADLRHKSMETAAAFLRDRTLRNCVNLDCLDRAGPARIAV